MLSLSEEMKSLEIGASKKSIIKDKDENSIELLWWILESGYNLDG